MVTVLLLAAILLGMTGCIKKETGNENSSQSQDKIKKGPDSPEEAATYKISLTEKFIFVF